MEVSDKLAAYTAGMVHNQHQSLEGIYKSYMAILGKKSLSG